MKVSQSSLNTALDNIRNGNSFSRDELDGVEAVMDTTYRDLLAIANGNEERAIQLYIFMIAKVLGNMLYRSFSKADRILEYFNDYIARLESKISVTLAWGKPGTKSE
jgi:hypothetical protein